MQQLAKNNDELRAQVATLQSGVERLACDSELSLEPLDKRIADPEGKM